MLGRGVWWTHREIKSLAGGEGVGGVSQLIGASVAHKGGGMFVSQLIGASVARTAGTVSFPRRRSEEQTPARYIN